MRDADLKNLRSRIDRLDDGILRLLNERSRVSIQIGRLKQKSRSGVFAPERESEVFERLNRANRGPLKPDALNAVYREIMSGSLSLEKPLSIAYLGPEFTFTHQASIKKFGHSVRYVSCAGIPDIFAEVENGRCDYGVAPVENSTEGAIVHTLDSFIDSSLKICSEITLKIRLNLLSCHSKLSDIRKIYSHPAVFGQCRKWLQANLSGAAHLAVSSTVQAAITSRSEAGAACIASPLAAGQKGLKVLAESIQDRSANFTRFLVLSRQDARPTRCDKTSIVLSVKDRPGALYRVLEPFRDGRINLSKIESRPSRLREWDYYFFIDFEAHAADPRAVRVLRRVEKECAFLKILGSYPRAAA